MPDPTLDPTNSDSDAAAPEPEDTQRTIDAFTEACRTQFAEAAWEGTMPEYLARLEADPRRLTRTAFQLIHDMVEYYGSEEVEDSGETVTRYNLFKDPFDDGLKQIFGLERPIMRLVKYIRSAAREEGKERIFVFHGPVGTAKTSMIDLIGRGLEDYTQKPEGDTFTFRWVFGKQFKPKRAAIGFSPAQAAPGLDEIVASIPSQLRDNPLYLIPKKIRREYLQQIFERKYGSESKWFIPYKILDGELDYNSRQIYDWLMKQYDGDWAQVMNHVRVERLTLSEVGGRGIAKVFPEGNIISGVAHLTFDENYKYIANLISSINLVKYQGNYVHANRGMIHYSDLFKRGAVHLQHLLSAVEEHKVDFGEVNADVDLMIIGTTNLWEYENIRQEPISAALRSRMRKIDVPYLLRYTDERRIYDVSLHQARRYRHIAPHTTELAALFAVLTRLEKSRLHEEVGGDKEIRMAIPEELWFKINKPLAKALLYADEMPPELSRREKELLTRDVRRKLRNENPIHPKLERMKGMLEGMLGIPTRILQNLFADLCEEATEECISPFQVFRGIEKITEQGPVNYDFLQITANDAFHEPDEFLEHLRRRYDSIVDHEVESALVAITHDEMEKRIREYLTHVTAYNKREKVENQVTGRTEDPSEEKMRFVEDSIGIERGDRDQWRFKVLSRATAHVVPGKPLDIAEVYRDLFEAVHRAIYVEKKSSINWRGIENGLQKSLTPEEINTAIEDSTVRRQVQSLLDNLIKDFDYCFHCGRKTALYFLARRERAALNLGTLPRTHI